MPDTPGKYILMHKNKPVAELTLEGSSGTILSIGTVYEPLHVPVGVPVKKGVIDRGALNAWWRGRAIPVSRMGIQAAMQELQLSGPGLLPEKCLGLSLSDQYWICPVGSGLTFREVNFFENPFSEDVGNILFGGGIDGDQLSLMSPDNTSDGWLRKKWVIIDGKRCLVKSGSGATCQEPYNEVLASRICRRLGIPHVSYAVAADTEGGTGRPCSICEDFITLDTELITAWHIMQTVKKPNHVSWYRHYLDCCMRLDIPGIKEAVDQMLVLDYLILNEDRHLNNFGAVRRADTLEYQGAAPIYDSGTSLWFDRPTGLIRAGVKTVCKPFKSSHEEQIELVTDFDWLDFSALAGIEEEWREIVKDSVFIDAARCDAVALAIRERCRMLEEAALLSRRQIFTDSTKFDVKENTAYSGE